MPLYKNIAPQSSVSLPSNLLKGVRDLTPMHFPSLGDVNTLYTATQTGKIYRWTGTKYVEIAPREEAYRYVITNNKEMPSSSQPLYLTEDDVSYKRISVSIGSLGSSHTDEGPFEIHLPTPVYTSDPPNTTFDGKKFQLLINVWPTSGSNGRQRVLPEVVFYAGSIAGPCPNGQCPNEIYRVSLVPSLAYSTLYFWFGCDMFTWSLIEPPTGTLSVGPTRASKYGVPEEIDNWRFSWNKTSGRVGYVQMFPIPLTYTPPDSYTEPQFNVSKEFPVTPDGFVDNPAHPINIPNFAFSTTQKPYFIGNWGLTTGGMAVNYPGYPVVGTKCALSESRVRLGALSARSYENGVRDMVYFSILADAKFMLGVVVDGVGDPQYAPDYIVVGAQPQIGEEIEGPTKGKSQLLTKNGVPKLVKFLCYAKAGATFYIQLINVTPTNPAEPNNLTRVMALSMLTFDQAP